MDSKILFRNTTTYTEDIAFEAGEAFWETQPAYKKRVKKYKVVAAVMAITFGIAAIVSLIKSGPMLLSIGAVAMALVAAFWFTKVEKMVRDSAKNFRGMDTRVTYGISENFFFVINRDYVGNDDEPQTKTEEIKEKLQEALEEAKEELAEAVDEVKEEVEELVEEEHEDDEDDYEDEFLSLEDLLVCIVTENLYILVWPKPYYILDRRCFDKGADEEFRSFIEEHARIIEV